MAAKKLALFSGQLHERAILKKSVDEEASHSLSLVEEVAFRSADFVILDEESSKKFDQSNTSHQSIILVGKRPGTNLAREMIRLHPQHILLNPDGDESINFSEVLWACQSKAALDPSSFLLNPFKKVEHTIRSTQDIAQTITNVFSQTNLENLFLTAAEQLELVANELLTNALYNGPINILDSDFKLVAEQRKNLVLPEPFEVQIQTLSNDKELALVVIDPFGSLSVDTIYNYFSKGLNGELSHENKKGGAGMGMALIRTICHRIGVSVVKGKKTQIICYIEKKKRHKEHQLHCKSLHIFVKE